MSIYYEKAREFGNFLLQSEQAKNLTAATNTFNDDADAKKKFDDYKMYQQNIQETMHEQAFSEEEYKKAMARLTEMSAELKENTTIAGLLYAEAEFNTFVNKVLDVLKATITGVVEEEGCGGCGNHGNSGGCCGGH